MGRKQVKCCNCGFLGFRQAYTASDDLLHSRRQFLEYKYNELDTKGRKEFSLGAPSYASELACVKHIWETPRDPDDKEKLDAFIKSLDSKRKCPFFFPYSPGYPPIEHRELQREAKTHRLLIKGMLLAALIGAVAAIVAQVIAR